jgi:two-component system, NtrC family, sensor kinase
LHHVTQAPAPTLPRKNRRILIIDDMPSIHEDFRKILGATRSVSHLEADEQALFGDTLASAPADTYEIDSAMQGTEGLEMVSRAARAGRPYALAFADMRMPPGWDGVETITRILAITPRIELCICSAYSDYSWHEVIRKVGRTGLRLLRKPFETHEVLSLTSELTDRWWRLNGEQRSAGHPRSGKP